MGIFKRMKDVWEQIFNPPPIIDVDMIRHAFMADPITPEEFLKPDKAAIEAKTRDFMKLGFLI